MASDLAEAEKTLYTLTVDTIRSKCETDQECAEECAREIFNSILSQVQIATKDNGVLSTEAMLKLLTISSDSPENHRLLQSLQAAVSSLKTQKDSPGPDELTDNLMKVKTLLEFLESLQKVITDIMTRLPLNQRSRILPLVDYMCLFLISLRSGSNSGGDCQKEEYSLNILLDIMLSCAHVTKHVIKNKAFMSTALKIAQSSNEGDNTTYSTWVTLTIFLLVRGGNNATEHLTEKICNQILTNFGTCTDEDRCQDIFCLFLAANNTFPYPTSNEQLKAFLSMKSHEVTDLLLAQVITMFNRRIDPLEKYYMSGDVSANSSSVLKFLLDIFQCGETVISKLIYTTDARVILDVILASMTDLNPGSQLRVDTLSLLDLAARYLPLLRNSPGYKLSEFTEALSPISQQTQCLEEALIASSILSQLNSVQ